jgi:hypothetical protein
MLQPAPGTARVHLVRLDHLLMPCGRKNQHPRKNSYMSMVTGEYFFSFMHTPSKLMQQNITTMRRLSTFSTWLL